MYWTSLAGRIMKADIDGLNSVQVVGGQLDPKGIAVDHDVSRLFWAVNSLHRIQSSNLAGGDVRTIVQLPGKSWPWGVAIHGNKLYWGNFGPESLQSSTKTGENVRTIYTGKSGPMHLTLTTTSLNRTRVNHCDEDSCSSLCVLTSTASRCLPWTT